MTALQERNWGFAVLTSHNALEARFETVRRGGFDPEQVEQFRRAATDALLTLERKVRELEARDLRSESDVVIAEVMAAAVETKDHIIAAAKQRAEELVEAAQVAADRMIAGASEEVRRLEQESSDLRVSRQHTVPQTAEAIAWEGTGPGASIDLVAVASTGGNGSDDSFRNAPHAYVVADTSLFDNHSRPVVDLRDPWRRKSD